MKITRRSVIAGSLAIPAAEWIRRAAGATTNLTRYSAHTKPGQDMLKIYASAVSAMNSTNKNSPLSWVFQWYTHCVPNVTGSPDPTAKNKAIRDIFGTSTSPEKSLADEMWDTCQAHGGQREDFFLPWHRMYVYFFERIVRSVSGHSGFTLPYWDYTATDSSHGVIPPEFGSRPLLVTNRNRGVNSGTPIDQNRPLKLNNDSLKQTAYESTGGAVLGFCADLDFNLHGNVHVYTGTATNMGAVPYAAGDPVFWAHHCNIDRFWASWNQYGGLNPDDSAYLEQTFVFADEMGKRIEAKVSDFLSIDALGYQYDQMLPKPAGFIPQQRSARTALMSALSKTPPPQMTKAAVVRLGGAKVSIALAAPEPTTRLSASLASAGAGRRLYLVARDISVRMQPGVVYDIFLNEEGNAPVGSINFFSVGHSHEGNTSSAFWSVDVTERAKAVTSHAGPGEAINVIMVPSGEAANGASVTIGSLSLVAL